MRDIQKAKDAGLLDGLYHAARWGISGLFIFSGLVKLAAPARFAGIIAAYGLLPDILVPVAAIALPGGRDTGWDMSAGQRSREPGDHHAPDAPFYGRSRLRYLAGPGCGLRVLQSRRPGSTSLSRSAAGYVPGHGDNGSFGWDVCLALPPRTAAGTVA